MEVGQQMIYKAVLTLGKLRFIAIKAEEIPTTDFCIKILKTGHNNDYGTHDFYQLEILTKGVASDINIGDFLISSYIKFNTEYLSSYNLTDHYFVLEGLKYRTESLKLVYCLPQHEKHDNVVYYVVYALLFLTKYQNVIKVDKVWKYLFSLNNISIGESIDMINNNKDSFAEIVSEYPFMKELLDQILGKRIDDIKQQLEKITFLQK